VKNCIEIINLIETKEEAIEKITQVFISSIINPASKSNNASLFHKYFINPFPL